MYNRAMRSDKAIKHYEEGRLLQGQGKLSSAERAYKKAIKSDQDFVEAYNNLGNVLADLSRLPEAANAYRKALKILPDHPMLLNNYGNALRLQGEDEKAIRWFEQAISQDSNYADAYANLGSVMHSLGQQDKALECYQQAVKLDPGQAGSFLNLGRLLIELEEPDAAIVNLEKAISLEPDDPIVHCTMGNALVARHAMSAAIDSYLKAIELDPDYADVYFRLAGVYKQLGQWQEVETNYRHAVALQPDHSAAYLGLSMLKDSDQDEDLLAAMKQQYRRPKLSPTKQSRLGFAIGNLHHKRKEYSEAFEHYEKANLLKWSSGQCDLEQDLAYFELLQEVFEPEVFEQAALPEAGESTPVFILGLPRSGKSLTETLLTGRAGICAAGEQHSLRDTLRELGDLQNPRAMVETILSLSGDEIARYTKTYSDEIQRYCSGESITVNTLPINFLYVGFIRLLLPGAKVIHCCRQPLDACWFIYQKAFTSKKYLYSSDLETLGSYYKGYSRLIEHWHSVLPGFMLDLHYEQMVSDSETEVSRLFSFLGLEPDGAELKEYENSALHRYEIGCWQNYEDYLGELKAALE